MLDALGAAAARHYLDVFGALHTLPSDGIGPGTLVLFGPKESGFWGHVVASPEWQDGEPDPIDRWSHRVITALADEANGTAHFPFGAPLHPFMTWAIRSGRAWSSPVHLLVHDRAGLMVSYRGALLLPETLPLPAPSASPCDSCEQRPCALACPATALTTKGYDLDACHAFLDSPKGADCMARGCAVRRSCPISITYGRIEAQSAFHMERFHP